MVKYQMYLKDEEKFGLIFDDCTYESKQGEIVDFAFANGLSYLNLKGLGKPEKSAKIDRLQEILEEMRRMQIALENTAGSEHASQRNASAASLIEQ